MDAVKGVANSTTVNVNVCCCCAYPADNDDVETGTEAKTAPPAAPTACNMAFGTRCRLSVGLALFDIFPSTRFGTLLLTTLFLLFIIAGSRPRHSRSTSFLLPALLSAFSSQLCSHPTTTTSASGLSSTFPLLSHHPHRPERTLLDYIFPHPSHDSLTSVFPPHSFHPLSAPLQPLHHAPFYTCKGVGARRWFAAQHDPPAPPRGQQDA
jgi:hypothetical protein